MSVIDPILQAIKDEITNDPHKRGYAGQKDAAIAQDQILRSAP